MPEQELNNNPTPDPDNLPPANPQDSTPSINNPDGNNNPPAPKNYSEQEFNGAVQLYTSALSESERKNQELQTELARLKTNPQSVHNPDEDKELLFKDPRTLIREEISRTVQPLNDFVTRAAKKEQYETLKLQFKAHPDYTNIFAKLEPMIDSIMMNMEPTVQNVQAAVIQAVGLATVRGGFSNNVNNNLPNNNNNNPPNNNNQNNNQPNNDMNLPAHLRPSAPGLSGAQNGNSNVTPKGNPIRPLTELEERVRKERGMSIVDWIDFGAVDSREVAWTDIGKEKK